MALLVPTKAQSAPLSSLPPAKQSYAAATLDLTKAVKTAVAESIREQRAADKEQKLVAIHNLRERGDDVRNISEQCEYMDSNVHVVKAIRIGQQPKKSRPRLLRVELLSAAEKSWLLKASKFLKTDPSAAGIFITSWLSSGELNKLRGVQSR